MYIVLLVQDQIFNKLVGYVERVCVLDLKLLQSFKYSCVVSFLFQMDMSKLNGFEGDWLLDFLQYNF